MINIKSPEEIALIRENGKKLAQIKDELKKDIVIGNTPANIEKKAEELIFKAGGQPSFKMVKGYRWATCINLNKGIVHGIPTSNVPFKDGDIVSLDIGMFYKGFHTDSAFTVAVGEIPAKTQDFLDTGKNALKLAISKAVVGNHIGDISKTIHTVLTKKGYSPSRDLTGHGVGRQLHEEPSIPGFWTGDANTPKIPQGAVLAIEVIYSLGSPELVLEEDGWTISTKDGKIAALFEETIAVTEGKPLVLSAH